MEANVMLAIREKRTTVVDLYHPLRQYIASAYSELEAATADDDLRAVRDLRAAAVESPSLPDPFSLEHRRSALLAYARALALVELRFPISPDRAHVHFPSFTWHDAFKTNKKVNLPSIQVERAAVLFNLGAVCSQIALAADRSTNVGIRIACVAFQSAAGAFALLRESGIAAKAVAAGATTVDVAPDCAGMLEKLMLAQAQECFFEKVIAGRKPPTLCSKVARQVGLFYEDASAALCAPPLSQHFDKTWVPHVQLKAAQFCAEACFRCSLHLRQQEEIALEIAHLKIGMSALSDAKKAAEGVASPLLDSANKLENNMKANLDRAMKENNSAYLMRVPDAGNLEVLPAASLVKSTSVVEVLDDSKEKLVSSLVTGDKMKALSMLLEKNRKDDILPKLMTGVGSQDDMLNKEIPKYEQICAEVADNISAQGQLFLQKQAQNERIGALFDLDDFKVAEILGAMPSVCLVKSSSLAVVLDPSKERLFLSLVPDDSRKPPSEYTEMDLPTDILLEIADRLRSAHQVERMRLVCRTWRNAIPSRMGPFLVISLSEGTSLDEVWFLKIQAAPDAADGLTRLERAFSPGIIPPRGTVCWGSAQGMMAMVVIPPAQMNLFLYCLHCAQINPLPPSDPDMIPKGIFFRAAQLHDHFLVALVPNADESRLLNDMIDWHDPEAGHHWVLYAGVEDHGVTSVAFIPSVLMGIATTSGEVIVDEISRPIQNIADLIYVRLPKEDDLLIPWEENHSHVFVSQGTLYLCLIFDRYSDMTIQVRLYRLENDGVHGYQLIRSSDLGPYSVFLGPNQGIVLPSLEGCVGRMANTIYVEDWSLMLREPRILAVNLSSQAVIHIDFPSGLAAEDDMHRFLPAVWVCSPAEKNMFGTCRCNRSQSSRCMADCKK